MASTGIPQSTGEQVRLLQCQDCRSVETLPEAPKSGPDSLLERLVARHQGPLTNEQNARRVRLGQGRSREINVDEPHFGNLHLVPKAQWDHPNTEQREALRQQILVQMWGENTGYPPEFYASKSTFTEDAGICFEKHGRPGQTDKSFACIDYQDESKRLTDREWKLRNPESMEVFLCSFCPFQSVVTTRIRSARGDYEA